jgi:hypothetical protein
MCFSTVRGRICVQKLRQIFIRIPPQVQKPTVALDGGFLIVVLLINLSEQITPALRWWCKRRAYSAQEPSELELQRQLNRAWAADLVERAEARFDTTSAETLSQHLH